MDDWRALVNELVNITISSQLCYVTMVTIWKNTGGFVDGRKILRWILNQCPELDGVSLGFRSLESPCEQFNIPINSQPCYVIMETIWKNTGDGRTILRWILKK